MTADRGVSEVLGFVLVFALVASTVGLVSVYGFGALEDTRDAEQVTNAERAFDVLAANMANMHEEGASSRATELSLDRAKLEVGSPVRINVSAHNASGSDVYAERSVDPIIYRGAEGTEIVYVAGAVFRDQETGGLMIQEPPMLLGSDRTLIPVIQTRHGGNVTSASGQTVRVRGELVSNRPLAGLSAAQSPYGNVTVNVTDSPRTELWAEYFESQPDTSCPVVDTNANRLSCEIDEPETLYVTLSRIEYEFET